MHIVTQFCPYDKVDMIPPHTRKRFMNSHYINSCKYLDQPLIMIYNKYYTCIETIYIVKTRTIISIINTSFKLLMTSVDCVMRLHYRIEK